MSTRQIESSATTRVPEPTMAPFSASAAGE
jgi:hypothetical protein